MVDFVKLLVDAGADVLGLFWEHWNYSIPQNWLKTLKSKLYRKSKTQGRYVLRDTIIFLLAFCFFVPCFFGGYEGALPTEGDSFSLSCF